MASAIDPTKMRLIKTVARDKAGFWCAAVDPAGKRLYAGGTDFAIHVIDLPDVQPSKTAFLKGHGSYVTGLVYLPRTQELVSGGFDKQLLWWKPAGGAVPVRKADARARVNRLTASADETLLATANNDLVGRIWDAATGTLKGELRGGHPATTKLGRHNTLYAIAFSPDGKQVATGDRAGTICIWETATYKLLRKPAAPVFYSQALSQTNLASEYEWGGVRALAFAADGKLLAAGGMGPADQGSAGTDGPMRLEAFDSATGKSSTAFLPQGSKGLVMSMFFHPDGQWLIAAGGGGQNGIGFGGICLWQHQQRDKSNKPVPPVYHKSSTILRDIVLSPDGNGLVAVGALRDLAAGRIEVWDLSGKAVAPTPVKPPAK
jgi:WD40 repeat protein